MNFHFFFLMKQTKYNIFVRKIQIIKHINPYTAAKGVSKTNSVNLPRAYKENTPYDTEGGK